MFFLTGLIVGLVFGWALKDRIAGRVSEEVMRRFPAQELDQPPVEKTRMNVDPFQQRSSVFNSVKQRSVL